LEKTHEIETIQEKDMPVMYVTRARQNVGKTGLAAIVYVHPGGGFTGSGLEEIPAMSNLTRDNELVIVSMNYALAPLARIPTQQHDVLKVLHYVQKNAARLGIDKAKIALYGTSAGGNIALGALQLLKN